MSASSSSHPADAVRITAAQWTIRRDRGLSAAESIEFELWLAADPRHRAAMARAQGAWAWLDRTPEGMARLELARAEAHRTTVRRLQRAGLLAAAAAFVMGAIGWWSSRPSATLPPARPALLAAGPREVTLADGTLVRLNASGEVHEEFTAGERQVRLTRGEAHFTVVPDPARPFVVVAGALRVRAVGTAFNVNLQAARVEVLVTEGRVRLGTEETAPARRPLVEAGQRAVVTTESPVGSAAGEPVMVITPVSAAEIARTLAWHDSLVRLGGATLGELALEFERRFGDRILIADPEIAQLRAGGRVRAEDAENFASLLATTFELELARTSGGVRVLRKKSTTSR